MNIKQAARSLAVSPRTIEKWVKRGCPHEKIDGELSFDADALRDWKKANPPGRPKSKLTIGMEEAKRRRAVAQAELAELELAREKGKVIEKAEVEASNVKKFAHIRNAFSGLPTRMAPVLYGRDAAEIDQLLTAEITKILEELSR